MHLEQLDQVRGLENMRGDLYPISAVVSRWKSLNRLLG